MDVRTTRWQDKVDDLIGGRTGNAHRRGTRSDGSDSQDVGRASDTGIVDFKGAISGLVNDRVSLSKLAIGAAGTVLKGGSNPSWGAVSLTADVSGTLPIASGGTGLNTTPTNGQLLIGNTATSSYVRATLTSSDSSVTITNGNGSIDLTVSSGIALTAAKFIFNEALTGANGVNTIFTLTQTPVLGKVMVFVNGVLQAGGTNDYAIAGSTITFQPASIPAAGDFVTATYIAQ